MKEQRTPTQETAQHNNPMGYECNRYQEHWLEINLEDYLDTSNYLMLIQYLNTDSTVEKEERYFKKHFFK